MKKNYIEPRLKRYDNEKCKSTHSLVNKSRKQALMSIQNSLQILAAAIWFFQRIFGTYLATFLFCYLFFTHYCWYNLLYLYWMYLDRNTCEMGGRFNRWVLNWSFWLYVKNYFPAQLSCVPGFSLDATRNYLFCCFPHGLVPTGPQCSFLTHQSDFHKLFPNFMVKLATLHVFFFVPFVRELELARGCISCSSKSIGNVLSKSEGSQIVALFPGGVPESFNNHPGKYKFLLKNRKGFVKVALQNGSPLVPVITFGGNDLYQLSQRPDWQKIQKFINGFIRTPPLLFYGRGFFQNHFGLIPRKRALTTVGIPIEVTKVENPTGEEVEALHQTFLRELTNLFESHKYKYLENPQETHLEFQ